jgi:glycosyltransferase involved in cell wall biosynthesis
MKMMILIPAYNESGIIGRVVKQIHAVALGLPYEILVIDDGSSDNTAEEARRAGARSVTLLQNLGYGHALRAGYQIAHEDGFDIVVQMDGDGQHAPTSIPDLLRPVLAGECDLVIGSRVLSDTPYPMPFARRVGQRFFSWVLLRMAGLKIQDPTSGFQVLGPKVLKLVMSDDFPGDYPDTDVLLYLKFHGTRIREAPAEFHINERGTSMHNGVIRPLYYLYKMLFSMVMVYFKYHGMKRTGEPS